MQKIKDDLIRKIYKVNLSKCALVILLDLINKSDEKGNVNIYYKDMIDTVKCSQAQYYNVLKELESHGFITRCKDREYKNENVIKIIGNDFTDEYKNYVDTNKQFFTNRTYSNLKAGAIRLYLYFIFRICKQKKNSYNKDYNKLLYNNSYDKISKQLGITVRMTIYYSQLLYKKGLICIAYEKIKTSKNKLDIITVNKENVKEPVIFATEKGKQTILKAKPMHLHLCHYIQLLCRRYKKEFNELNLNDSALLMYQYKNKAMDQNKNIYTVFKNAFNNLTGNKLDSKNLHFIVRSLIELDYTQSIIAH